MESLSFKEYVDKIIAGKMEKNQNKLYSISNSENKDLITHKGLNVFLDEEEKRQNK